MDYNDFFYDGTDEEDYEKINQTIIYGDVMNMSLITMEGDYGDIDADYSSFNGYHIIKISSSPYTLKAYLVIDGQVISSSEMVCEGAYYFPIDINSHYYVVQKIQQYNLSLGTIININVNIICYDSKYVVPTCLWYFHRIITIHCHLYTSQRNNMII